MGEMNKVSSEESTIKLIYNRSHCRSCAQNDMIKMCWNTTLETVKNWE